jgi:hypothetical protein
MTCNQMKTWSHIKCYQLGLIIKTKAKDRKMVKKMSWNSITFSIWSESQPSQMVFPQVKAMWSLEFLGQKW